MVLSLGECARLACVWEVTAPKAGNVHPGRAFPGLSHQDFLDSAAAIAPVFESAASVPVGTTILEAIRATRAVVPSNTNLGIVLLLAPLAAAPRPQSLQEGIGAVLARLTVDDSRRTFEAIRLANPGGMGKVPSQDVAAEPTAHLGAIMALAADRDMVARQYVNGFHDVLAFGVPVLLERLASQERERLDSFTIVNSGRLGSRFATALEQAILTTHLTFLARFPDSLIVRKRGPEEAAEASRRAQVVLDAGWPTTMASRAAFAALDAWLTEVGNARNPGTSADLVTACLFAALREGHVGTSFQLVRTS